ncbi:aminotransferase class I and II [Hymenobacter sp. RP-2-7]|uniref:Aminotransferase class I and II n=1 Tax=Hymenobacter polaris TaxID=2682546 RepID=A0A7Y0ABH5_9BACT|nr:HipA family kinase [Hymenobacter polaris]NML64279.1 aminotransferase class I and II [Hymenobacter polaris]
MHPTSPFTIRTVDVSRYILPLREGGSLPALVEASDGFYYVLKFRGAGQGINVLVAELLVGEVARALGLRVPELVFCELAEAFGRTEPDEEIQDLLRASTGLNLGLHFLRGANTFDPLVTKVSAEEASLVVWLDCFTLNVDRTARNTNLLVWHQELWLIDHGAALYVHHTGPDWASSSKPRVFPQVRDHVLLPWASELAAADTLAHQRLTPPVLQRIVDLLPDDWLEKADATRPPAAQRQAYYHFLSARLAASATFVAEANAARRALI